ncbi:MAG TPA: type IVB secretion system protein IcmH/DotU [Steroidobacteraceae bacterium]|nr:type IVB secretion system protein IcmH/DotU [Steroidobacteraceae bacterium]
MPSSDDPFKPKDGTVLRPQPGGARRGAPAAPPPGATRSPRAPGAAEALPVGARDTLGTGLNPLLQAASPLLMLAGRLRATLSLGDVAGLRRQTVEDLRRFEERAKAGGVASEIVVAARYALCAALDEAVLATPWGQQSEWAQQTLLVALHREAYGGEKFFDMLDRIAGDPTRHIDLMELQYFCIALGFMGKYQVQDRGEARLAEVQHDLYRRIREFRGAPPPELSLRWKGLEDRRNPLLRFVPWWVVAAATAAVLAIAFVVFRALLGSTASPVHEALAKVGLEGFTTPVAAPARSARLAELLAPDIAARTVTVEEQGGRTLVTLVAPDLFASASSLVNPAHLETLQHVAAALDQSPGRILIVGHTDDQPVRSLRYRDNFELSRDRAVSVAKLLKAALRDPARIEWTGVGSSQPRYTPESLPENRARNRRVEIVHVAAGTGP